MGLICVLLGLVMDVYNDVSRNYKYVIYMTLICQTFMASELSPNWNNKTI